MKNPNADLDYGFDWRACLGASLQDVLLKVREAMGLEIGDPDGVSAAIHAVICEQGTAMPVFEAHSI